MTNPVDHGLAEWIADHRVAPVTAVCRHLEDLGTNYGFFTLVALAVVVVVAVRRTWWGLLSAFVAWFAAVVVMAPLKDLFDRPRPGPSLAITTLSESSFPSTHAIITSAAVVALVGTRWWTSDRLRRAVAWIGVAGCVLSGAAMIYLGGHWLTDVLAGWVIGTAISGGVLLLWHRLPVPGGNRPVRRATMA